MKKNNDINLKVSYEELMIVYNSLMIASVERIDALNKSIIIYTNCVNELCKHRLEKRIAIIKDMQIEINETISSINKIDNIIREIEEIQKNIAIKKTVSYEKP